MRTIRTRRIAFAYPDDALPKHFANDDLIMSHVVAVLSAMFPEGEDFFVRSVRRYRDDIADPELKRQVAGFIGQEAMHGREHRTLNHRLQRMWYPTWTIDRLVKLGFVVGERVLPGPVQLAITAALEHYTATLAEVLLGDEEARRRLGDTEVTSMLLWHAVEESEHKSVAFDVFQTVSGDQRIRAGVMDAVTAGFIVGVILGTLSSMAFDRSTYNPRRLARSLRALPTSPWLSKAVRHRIRDYNRRDFHPDDNDASELLERWRTELFGDAGTLADRLKTAS